MSRENRQELGRIPTSPEKQVDAIEKLSRSIIREWDFGSTHSTQKMGKPSTRKSKQNKTAGKGSTVGRNPQRKHVPHLRWINVQATE
jgi:hypothetical protein